MDFFIGVIHRTTSTGSTTDYPLPDPNSGPARIVRGPGGALWFTESGVSSSQGNRIGRITTGGIISEFPVPTPNSAPLGITLGPDGAIWFTESRAGKVGRLGP